MGYRLRSFTITFLLVDAVLLGGFLLVRPTEIDQAPSSVQVIIVASESPESPESPEQSSPSPDDDEPQWQPPKPVSSTQRVPQRQRMVQQQIAHGRGRKVVKDKQVLEAMRTVPRHVFVPANRQSQAYRDGPVLIGEGQTISQPYIVAFMTEQLGLTPKSKVLEIGTGSGYQAAVLAQLTPHVYSIEIIDVLAKRAQRVLREQGYKGLHLKRGDGYHGWPEHAPYDAIIVTCAAGHLPPPLWDQLKPGGRIVIPVGGAYAAQRLIVVTKTKEGKRRSQAVMGVRFVPMTGQVQR